MASGGCRQPRMEQKSGALQHESSLAEAGQLSEQVEGAIGQEGCEQERGEEGEWGG
jgi:hypothetical protein